MRESNRDDDRHGGIRAVALGVFTGLLIVVVTQDMGYGLIASVAVFLGVGGYEVLLGRQIQF